MQDKSCLYRKMCCCNGESRKGSAGTEVDELNMNISGAGKETSLTDAVKRTRITENNHFSGRYYYGQSEVIAAVCRKYFFKSRMTESDGENRLL